VKKEDVLFCAQLLPLIVITTTITHLLGKPYVYQTDSSNGNLQPWNLLRVWFIYLQSQHGFKNIKSEAFIEPHKSIFPLKSLLFTATKILQKGYSRSEINCYSSKYSEPFGRKIVRLITSCFHVVLYNR